jgi:hypothetical protein
MITPNSPVFFLLILLKIGKSDSCSGKPTDDFEKSVSPLFLQKKPDVRHGLPILFVLVATKAWSGFSDEHACGEEARRKLQG